MRAQATARWLESLQYPFEWFLRLARLPAVIYALYVGTSIFQTTYDAHWKTQENGYFAFSLLGALALFPSQFVVTTVPARIQFAVWSGELAASWALPVPKAILLIGSSLSDALLRCMVAVSVTLFLIRRQHESLSVSTIAVVVCSFVLCVAVYFCVGAISSAILLVIRRGDLVVSAVSFATTYCAGVFVPVDALPAWARVLSPFVPLTHALRIVRDAAAPGVSSNALEPLGILLGMFVVCAGIAGIVVNASIEYVESSGAITRY